MPVVDEPGLRPTPERVRETLFNWLAPAIEGAVCLDLFAGTGALGLEALSRGARKAEFVETSPAAVKALRAALQTLGTERGRVLQTDAFDYLRRGATHSFDVVFLDPPFADEANGELCRLLADGGFVGPGSRVYLEQDRGAAKPELPEGWTVLRDKTAGRVRYLLAGVSA